MFHKLLEQKTIIGVSVDHCAVISNFCYTPENKTISVCFKNILHDHPSGAILNLTNESYSYWCNITTPEQYAQLEALLFAEGVDAVVAAVYDLYQNQIFLRFCQREWIS